MNRGRAGAQAIWWITLIIVHVTLLVTGHWEIASVWVAGAIVALLWRFVAVWRWAGEVVREEQPRDWG